MGLIEETIARQSMRAIRKLPDRIENAPQLYEYLQLYLKGFFDLDSTRTLSRERLEQISIINILKYCQLLELDDYQTDCMIEFIGALDSHHLKKVSKKAMSK